MTYIDTRDLNNELNDLADRGDAVALYIEDYAAGDGDPAELSAALADEGLIPLTEEEHARLAELRDLADEIGDEFRHGETMIPEDDFEDYARQLAEDIGRYNGDESWPLNHIDWEAAAASLRETDYREVEWEGATYLVHV